MIGRATRFRYTTSATEISELLESDDELPDSYDEIPHVPAYQDDHRFEPQEHNNMDFHWLHQQLEDASSRTEHMKQNSLETKPCATNKTLPTELSPLCDDVCSNEISPKVTTQVKKNKKNIVISKGVLSKRDIFYVKSIEQYSTDTTLLWFIDFMIHKTVHPFQRSCLVAEITPNHYTAAKEQLPNFNMRYYLKLVIH